MMNTIIVNHKKAIISSVLNKAQGSQTLNRLHLLCLGFVVVMAVQSATAAFTNDPRCPADFDPLKSCPSSMILPAGAGFDLTRSIDPTTCNDQENCPRCLGDDTWIQKLKDEVGLYSALRDPDFKPWVIVDNWLSREIVSTITMILLRDTMNISARAGNMYSNANVDFICCSEAMLSMEQWGTAGVFLNDTVENTIATQPIGYTGQSAFYVLPHTVKNNPFSFTYQAYKYLDDYKTIFPPSFSTDCTNMTVNSSAGCVAGNYVCESNFWTNTSCYDNKWYVPPQCNIPGEVGSPNTTHCQEVLMVNPAFDSGFFEGLIKNNNLNMTAAYLGTARHNEIVREAAVREKNIMFYWYEPDPLVAQLEAVPVRFPKSTPECEAQRNADPTLNTANCTFPSLTLQKRTRSDALEADVDFKYFFNTFSLTRTQIDALMVQHTSAGGNSTVYDLSCSWIKDNFDTWKDMVQNTPSIAAQSTDASSALSNPGVLAGIIVIPVLIVLAVCAVVLWFVCSKRMKLKNAPKTAPLALVFTDIENSTMLWEACGDDMGLAVEIHHAIIRKHIEEFGAYEVKTIGDSFMIACSSLGDATLMCLAIQTSLGECRDFPTQLQFVRDEQPFEISDAIDSSGYNKSVSSVRLFDTDAGGLLGSTSTAPTSCPSIRGSRGDGGATSGQNYKNGDFHHPIRVLMGLHWCHEVNPTIDRMHGRYDYYGHDVNVCARIAAQAQGGQIILSADTMVAVMDTDEYPLMIAPQTVSVIARHDVTLKGISDKVMIYAMAPLTQIASGYVASKLLNEGSRGMRSTSRGSFLNSGTDSTAGGEDTTGRSSKGSEFSQRNTKSTVQYSAALLRLTFKAVPDGVKTEWITTLAKTLRIKIMNKKKDDKQEQSARFEELRTGVKENCTQSLTATNSLGGGGEETIDGSMGSTGQSISTLRRQSVYSAVS